MWSGTRLQKKAHLENGNKKEIYKTHTPHTKTGRAPARAPEKERKKSKVSTNRQIKYRGAEQPQFQKADLKANEIFMPETEKEALRSLKVGKELPPLT